MATSKFQCGNCGHIMYTRWDAGFFNKPTSCPCCGKIGSFNTVETTFDSPEEKAEHEFDQRMNRHIFKLFAGAAFIAVLMFFPGVLLLMLLHQFVEIDSSFWNWTLTALLSIPVFVLCKGNIVTYLMVDAILLLVSTIIAWIVKDFCPWAFVIDTLFCSIWGGIFTLLIGGIVGWMLIPQDVLAPQWINDHLKEKNII